MKVNARMKKKGRQRQIFLMHCCLLFRNVMASSEYQDLFAFLMAQGHQTG